MAQKSPKSIKAQITRASLVIAAAGILRDQGPEAVTYRQVAKVAGVSPSSTGYYFTSISELLHEAGEYNIQQWAQRAERVAQSVAAMTTEEARAKASQLIIHACLPSDDNANHASHYKQLLAASNSSEVTTAYGKGRIRLDRAVQDVLDKIGWNISARFLIAMVDGAAVAAISEGHSVKQNAEDLIAELEEVVPKV